MRVHCGANQLVVEIPIASPDSTVAQSRIRVAVRTWPGNWIAAGGGPSSVRVLAKTDELDRSSRTYLGRLSAQARGVFAGRLAYVGNGRGGENWRFHLGQLACSVR